MLNRFAPGPLFLTLLWACGVPETSGPSDDTAPDTDTDITPPGNQAPSAPVVAVTPVHPTDEEDLSVTLVTPATDPEGSAVTYTYGWTVDGNLRADLVGEMVAASETADGQAWAVSVTPSDGEVSGTPGTASVIVGNSAPSPVGFHIDPETPAPGGPLSVVVDTPSLDPDGDEVTITIEWYENGAHNAAWDGLSSILGVYVEGGEVFRVTMTASDGKHPGVSSEDTVELANLPPEIHQVSVQPLYPDDDDPIEAVVSSEDPDGSTPLTHHFVWARDGVEASDVGDVDTVPASATSPEEAWSVTVTASDGHAEAGPVESNVVRVIPWEGRASRSTATARFEPDGTGGFSLVDAQWAYDMLSYGATSGNHSCQLGWSLEGSPATEWCPTCPYEFSVIYTLDPASTVDFGCENAARDGTGYFLVGPYEDYSIMFHSSAYFESDTYAFLIGRSPASYISYSYLGTYYLLSYGMTLTEDSAGVVEFYAFHDYVNQVGL